MQLFSHYLNRTAQHSAAPHGWKNHVLGDALLYSYRDTLYHRGDFPSQLHYHDYYELLIVERGEIRYTCESHTYVPRAGDVILIPPGKFHMSEINAHSTRYVRNVFYLYPSAFSAAGLDCLCDFLARPQGQCVLTLPSPDKTQALLALLKRLQEALAAGDAPLERGLALSFVIQIFYLLNTALPHAPDAAPLPQNLLQIKQYIDEHYATVQSVTQIAQQFFYSREYTSRLFKKHFDITISGYILKRRIAKSQHLLAQGASITDTAFAVGFGSHSAFIAAFRAETGLTPSAYRKLKRQGNGI